MVRLDLSISICCILIIIGCIREMYIKTKLQGMDYEQGYNDAPNEFVDKWNEACKDATYVDFVKLMKKYLQDKLNGGG